MSNEPHPAEYLLDMEELKSMYKEVLDQSGNSELAANSVGEAARAMFASEAADLVMRSGAIETVLQKNGIIAE